MQVTSGQCLNIHHNAVDCLEADLPREKWCITCQASSYLNLRFEYLEKMRNAEKRVKEGTLSQRDCDICGEPLDEEIGEFYDPSHPDTHVIAHAQCGLDKRYLIA